uniref:Uncharacterized protein n=1 Tax=Vitis vinifera TaxID=29760 RepID=A5BE86_VITVI|nr:hypothetical protein VITISV_002606 [Vitis vinifera]
MKKVDNRQLSQPTGSQISEVLQSDGGNMNSPKEANGNLSKLLGSEVTSMYSRRYLHQFPVNNVQASVDTLVDMMDRGHGIVMPSMHDSCHMLQSLLMTLHSAYVLARLKIHTMLMFKAPCRAIGVAYSLLPMFLAPKKVLKVVLTFTKETSWMRSQAW